jgi:DNA repair protein RecN (Recombination protein N)
MLSHLRIEKFLLIENLSVEFGKGLNVISGETGTGKSMTLSAVEFVLGKAGDYEDGTAVEMEVLKEEEPVILRREVTGGGAGTSLMEEERASAQLEK